MDLLGSISKIPQKHLLIYLLILGLAPLLVVFCFFWVDLERVDNVQNYLEDMQDQAERIEKKQAANLATREKYQDADHFYIDKNLETLQFLTPELEGLQRLTQNPNYIEEEQTRKRLNFLSGKQNHLSFSESNVQSSAFFKEVTESLLHPVEVNLLDLKKILVLVEGREIAPYKPASGRPQLLILDFKIDKKNIRENNEVYDLNLKLLKREFP